MRGVDREQGFDVQPPGALEGTSPLFAELYAETGRPSISPERLLRALLMRAR